MYDDETQVLLDAHRRGTLLVQRLLEQQAQIEANPPQLPPAQLAEGRAAVQNAVNSARKMVQSLEEAMRIVGISPPERP